MLYPVMFGGAGCVSEQVHLPKIKAEPSTALEAKTERTVFPESIAFDSSKRQVQIAVRPFLGEGQFPHEIAPGFVISGNVQFVGTLIINGKKVDKLPDAPDIPPDWASGIQRMLEDQLRSIGNFKVVQYDPKFDRGPIKGGPFVVRGIVGDFGEVKKEGETYGKVVLDIALIDSARGEVQESFRVSGEQSGGFDDSVTSLGNWSDFMNARSHGPLYVALEKALRQSARRAAELLLRK